MKVFNLTDVSTTVLEQRNLVRQHFAVDRRMLAPGEYIEVEDTPKNRAALGLLLQVGAVSIDRLSPAYVQLRARMTSQTSRLGSVVPVQHVDMRETKSVELPEAPPILPVEPPVVLSAYDPMASSEAEAEVPEEVSVKVLDVAASYKPGGGKKKGHR